MQQTAKADPAPRLKITEVFYSLQGESNTVGWPTVFIRLTGCPLRCRYCDTAYAFHGGQWTGLDTLLTRVATYSPQWVTVTGGEPMAQKHTPALLTALCDAGYEVSLETSGAVDLSQVDHRVSKVMDIKTPGSGEAHRHLDANVEYLTPKDQIKFVICDRDDYEWSKSRVMDHGLHRLCTVLFSPAADRLAPAQLADWLLTDRLPVRFQMQLHKVLWGDEPGR